MRGRKGSLRDLLEGNLCSYLTRREPLGGARPRLGSFFFTVPRRCVRLERAQKVPGNSGDLVDGRKECGLVRFRWLVEAAHFPHELQRGRADLFVGHGRFEVEEGLDVSAHRRYLDVVCYSCGGELRRGR